MSGPNTSSPLASLACAQHLRASVTTEVKQTLHGHVGLQPYQRFKKLTPTCLQLTSRRSLCSSLPPCRVSVLLLLLAHLERGERLRPLQSLVRVFVVDPIAHSAQHQRQAPREAPGVVLA